MVHLAEIVIFGPLISQVELLHLSLREDLTGDHLSGSPHASVGLLAWMAELRAFLALETADFPDVDRRLVIQV